MYYIGLFLAFLLLSTILFLLQQFLPFSAPLASLLLLLLTLLGLALTFFYFQFYYIHVEDDIITVREGLVTSKMLVIPFNKITEIETNRTLLESLFGIGTIKINTSGTSGVEIVFKNVPKENIDTFIGIFRRYKTEVEAVEPKGRKPELKEKNFEDKDMW